MSWLRVAWAFLVRDFLSEFSYRLSFLLVVAGLFIQVATWYFISYFVETIGQREVLHALTQNLDYFSYVLVGMMLQRFMNIAMYNYAGAIRSEQMSGTLEAMLVTPTPLSRIMVGASVWSYVMSAVQMGLMLLVGVFVFGVRLQPAGIWVMTATLLLSVLALSGIGILSAAFIVYFKRGNPVNFLISTASLLFGNVIIPSAALPARFAWISRLVPISYATEAMRGAVYRGAGFAEVGPQLLVLAGFGAVLLPVGLFAIRLAVRAAKREGTLVQY